MANKRKFSSSKKRPGGKFRKNSQKKSVPSKRQSNKGKGGSKKKDDDSGDEHFSPSPHILKKREEKRKAQESQHSNTKKKNQKKQQKRDIVTRVPEGVSWRSAGVHPKLIESLLSIGFYHPTPIQQTTLYYGMNGTKNIIAAAQTGSGKTLSFGIPIVHQILTHIDKEGEDANTRLMYCLAMSPSRELTIQIRDHLNAITKSTNIKVMAIVGGLADQKQIRLLKGRPHIVTATPGRLAKLIKDEDIEFLRSSLNLNLKYLVLDEGDRLLEKNHFTDLSDIIMLLKGPAPDKNWGSTMMPGIVKDESKLSTKQKEHVRTFDSCFTEYNSLEEMESAGGSNNNQINYMLPGNIEKRKEKASKEFTNMLKKRQIFITSATLTLGPRNRKKDDTANYLIDLVSKVGAPISTYKILDINPTHEMAETMKEKKIECAEGDKDLLTYYFCVTHPGRTIIFVNSVACVRRLHSIFKILKLPVYMLFAGMQQRQRLKNLDHFKNEDNAIVIATDVVGRGVDVKNVLYVLHYQFPRTTDVYVHRSGRTARAYQPGLVVSLVDPSDALQFKRTCNELGHKDGLETLEVENALKPGLRDRLAVAIKIDKMENKRNKNQNELNWIEKTAEDAGIDLDEEDVHQLKSNAHQTKQDKQQLQSLHNQLDKLLKKDIRISKGSFPTSAKNLIRREMQKKLKSDQITPNS
eukprot:NODE_1034_length_2164_cov_19.221950_g884_i0.p1 GENE.NODE_1034_length_2164_cov_19.221950_g884_i0~~NODE_1034_length_2164_cov_19.221950_g884_i0.p1  ORF type:complete len:708 (+),score=137.65 NODE_1034_length_2164_cov_19.221950_g884_i0:51-2126(+)